MTGFMWAWTGLAVFWFIALLASAITGDVDFGKGALGLASLAMLRIEFIVADMK